MIKQHKSTVLFEPATANCSCNCRNSYSYPLDKKCQQCLKRCLVYKADLHTDCGAKDWDFSDLTTATIQCPFKVDFTRIKQSF